MHKSSNRLREYGRSIALGALFGIALALVFCAGFIVRDLVDETSVVFAADGEGYPLLDEVQGLLDRHYLRQQPDYTARQYGAIRGVLSTLEDRNTFFIEPPVAASEADVLAGTYGGIGVSLQRDAAGLFVLYPFPDSPAAAAGIQDGDILIGVNAVEITGGEQKDAVDQMLRGEVTGENGVDLTVRREGENEPLTFFVPFDVINVPSVLWRVLSEDETIGLIQILRFTNRTPSELDEAIAELTEAGISSLIVDIRNNGGGLLQEAIDVAGIFLDGGVVLYEQTRDGERTYTAEEGGSAIDYPLVLLVNRGTASAAELVAGAIQDRERGILIGQTTYGKGTIQQIFALSDTSSIHVTSAEWFTPNRNVIDGVGLEPNIAMVPAQDGRDIEMVEAIDYLQNLEAETEE